VLPANPSAQVNTIASPDKAAFDANTARHEAFLAKEAASRQAVNARLQNVSRNASIDRIRTALTGPRALGDPGYRRGLQTQLASLQLEGKDTAATKGVIDPLSTPTVIAERLRQDGADRRDQRKAADANNLQEGLKLIPGDPLRKTPDMWVGANKQGVPVQIPTDKMDQYRQLYQNGIQNNQVDPNTPFLDWVLAGLSVGKTSAQG